MSHLHAVQQQFPVPRRYVAANDLAHAVSLLAAAPEGTARIVAGGTDLLLEIDRGVRRDVDLLIDISRCTDGCAIHIRDDVAILGPTVTHNDVVKHAVLVQRSLPLAQACLEVGSPQLRNRATVAGNIVTASPANDTISALLALGASVELTSIHGVRVVKIDEFVTGFRRTAMAANEVVTAVRVPLLSERQRGIYAKLGNRSAQAISVVHAAVIVELANDGTVSEAAIALGSVAATVVLIPAATAALVGSPLTPQSIAAAADAACQAVTPIADIRASAQYRSDAVRVLVRRCLQTLAADTQASRWPAQAPTLGTRSTPSIPYLAGIELAPTDVIAATVNGAQFCAPGAVGLTLLDWLRDELGQQGTKEGCAEGECGACTVQLDGAAVMSCLVPAARADGASIVTVEGLSSGSEMHPVQAAFVECGAVQCGFCTPGFIVATSSLLSECPRPSPEQIRQGLAGNLCRCTGYNSIIQAVQVAVDKGQQ